MTILTTVLAPWGPLLEKAGTGVTWAFMDDRSVKAVGRTPLQGQQALDAALAVTTNFDCSVFGIKKTTPSGRCGKTAKRLSRPSGHQTPGVR